MAEMTTAGRALLMQAILWVETHPPKNVTHALIVDADIKAARRKLNAGRYAGACYHVAEAMQRCPGAPAVLLLRLRNPYKAVQ